MLSGRVRNRDDIIIVKWEKVLVSNKKILQKSMMGDRIVIRGMEETLQMMKRCLNITEAYITEGERDGNICELPCGSI